VRLGNFLVGEKIGEGGSGIVYRAEQIEPVKRSAAVKVLKADSERALARFEAERQALALLDHPNIARFFDAGTTDEGQAYVAMELVAGRSIDKHCSEKGLPVDERVRLLQAVADAVQSGHSQGIVHRDLKPSNVLVDGDGNPKVIDFGIARASEQLLTETTLLTSSDELLGTPDYLSPEQAEGDRDIDARSDVHALGAILYELLSGAPPFDLAGRGIGIAQALDEIRHREPSVPPGPNELGLIALKALSKEPDRRYANAGEFAADLGRFLDEEPVRARPPSLAYRMGKLVRRHKLATAAVAFATLALVAATVVSGIMAFRAKRAAGDASRAFAQSDFQRATQLMLANDQDHAVAFLCRGLRENPDDKIALRQLMLLLTMTDFPQPIAELPIGNGSQLSIAISEDGSTGVVEEAGRKVTFFDIENPDNPRRSLELPGAARVLATIPQEDKVAISAYGVGVCILDYRTGDYATEIFPDKVKMYHGAPSKDGQSIVLAGRKKLQVLDWKIGKARWAKEMKATIVAIDLSPDGQLVAVIGTDGVFYLLNASDGEPAVSPRSFGNQGTAVKFTPDGTKCAVAVGPGREGREGVVHLLELDPGAGEKPERILPIGGDPYSLEFVCGGSHMLITPAHGYVANLWDLKNGRMVARTSAIHQSVFGTGVALADGSRVFTADRSGIVRQWDGESMKPTAAPFRMGSLCDRLISTPDSRRLITHDVNGYVQIWDTRHRAIPIRFFSRRGKVIVARLSPSGDRLATVSSDGFFRVWDTHTNQPLLEMKTPVEAVADFDWRARGLALGLPDGSVRAYKLGDDDEINFCGEWKLDRQVWLVRVSSDGKVVAGSDAGEVGVFQPRVEDVPAAELDRRKLKGWVTAANWGAGNSLAVGTSEGDAALWRDGKFVGKLEHNSEPDAPRKIHDFAFAPDGMILSALRRDGQILVWNAPDLKALPFDFDHGTHAHDDFQMRQRIGFGEGGAIYSLSCYDNRLRAWDTGTGKQIWEGLAKRYVGRSLALNPATGELCGFERLSITDAQSGRLIASELDLTFGDGDHAQGLSFSADGRYLAVPGGWGSTRLHTFPAMPESPANEWFLQFAEHWVGARVGEDGNVRLIPIRDRLSGYIDGECPSDVPPRQREIAEWLRAPVEERAAAPGEALSMRDALDALSVQTDVRAARSALWYRPGDPQAMRTLSKELRRGFPYPAIIPMAQFYSREADQED